MYESLFLSHPFSPNGNESLNTIENNVMSKTYSKAWSNPYVGEIIEGCFSDQAERPKMREILKKPLFKGVSQKLEDGCLPIGILEGDDRKRAAQAESEESEDENEYDERLNGLKVPDFQIEKYLGKGAGYGPTLLVSKDKSKYIAKSVPWSNAQDLQNAYKKIEALRSLRSDFVVKYSDYIPKDQWQDSL
ncbi:Oidioi.mRNA.OKI2018_I69.chr1.g2220.t1.cds [Oikopleura dioica]|uniref:Oidioi.mRNA.OKI2018_I69.chr1.g2220.t1.cds n=1 Tax=Oikopleura dioica TaxID=34765 RepID=A0ABN7SUM8_OIKDI|nr:Oidioi.mRNA.OKI2018_I69.chr1.g2220.t1.cds [Oikopleura dioica]